MIVRDRWVDYLNKFYLTTNSTLEQNILYVFSSHLKIENPIYLAILLIHCYMVSCILLFNVLFKSTNLQPISGEPLFYTLYVDRKMHTVPASQCAYLLSSLSTLNSIENYYYHIEFRMDSMHIRMQAVSLSVIPASVWCRCNGKSYH